MIKTLIVCALIIAIANTQSLLNTGLGVGTGLGLTGLGAGIGTGISPLSLGMNTLSPSLQLGLNQLAFSPIGLGLGGTGAQQQGYRTYGYTAYSPETGPISQTYYEPIH